MPDTKKIIKRQMFPLLTLRGITVFPYMTMHLDVGRVKSVRAIEEAMRQHQLVFLVTQTDASVEVPSIEDLYTVGVIPTARLLGIIRPCAPAHSAHLINAPKLCGSSIESAITIRGFSPRLFASSIISSIVEYSLIEAIATMP